MLKRFVILALVLVVALAACGDDSSPFVDPDGTVSSGGDGGGTSGPLGGGGDDDGPTSGGLTDPDEVALSQTISDGILQGMEDTGGELDIIGPPEARCLGDGLVSELGADRLEEMGLSPGADLNDVELALDDLSQAEIQGVVTMALECIDVRPLVVDLLTENGISTDSANCLADEILDPATINSLIAMLMDAASEGGDLTSLTENQQLIGTVMSILGQCLTPEELGNLVGGLSEGGGLGILGG